MIQVSIDPWRSIAGIITSRTLAKIVRPVAFAYKMQQGLMLRCRPFRCRNRRHWLDALARARRHQPRAIIAKRFGSIGVTNHRRQTLSMIQRRWPFKRAMRSARKS
jgi:hypothetical protein